MNLSLHSSRLAISDGASESFDSKTWANLIVDEFVFNPKFNSSWLKKSIEFYINKFDQNTLSWSKQASFERGSFATLIGAEEFENHTAVDILAVGDSLAVLLEDYCAIETFPYTKAAQFTERPELFCTNPALNSFTEEADFFSRHLKTWQYGQLKRPRLLCMTDALGEWALRKLEEGFPQWELLVSIDSVEKLTTLVTRERANKQMRVDDVTLVSIELGGYELPQS